MSSPSEKSLPAVWTGILAFLLVLGLFGVVLWVSYGGAQAPPHSESGDGPLEGELRCCGYVSGWVEETLEHYKHSSETAAGAGGAHFSRFFNEVLPWHLERRPVLLYLFAFFELAVIYGSYRLWLWEQAEKTNPWPGVRRPAAKTQIG